EVIANEQRVLHGTGRNDASLADGAVDQQEYERHPKPSDDFAAEFLPWGEAFFRWFRFLRLHGCNLYLDFTARRTFYRSRSTVTGGTMELSYSLPTSASPTFPLPACPRTSSWTRSVGYWPV